MFELQFKSMMQGATEGIDEFHKVGKLSNQIKQLAGCFLEKKHVEVSVKKNPQSALYTNLGVITKGNPRFILGLRVHG